VNIHVLAKKFQKLDAEDLMELVKLVKANQTADMYVKEDGEGKSISGKLIAVREAANSKSYVLTLHLLNISWRVPHRSSDIGRRSSQYPVAFLHGTA